MRGTALLFVAAVTSVAHAEGRDAGYISKDVLELEIDQCVSDKTISKDELLGRGGEYYQRGEVLYLQGDYKGAVQELVSSYCQVPFYSILKDIGQAYERELEYGRAIAYFSRYVLDVPADAKRANTCAPDPQEDKKNVLARIQVLEKLPAKIRVQVTPNDAHVSIVQDSIVRSYGNSGTELVVPGGPYQLVIERAGFHSVTREIHPEIGKPYTYFETLSAIKGHLRVRTIPGDARIFLDNRLVASGLYETDLPGGKYHVSVEAQERVTVNQDVDVLADKDADISIDMPREPEFGRKQLLLYSVFGGGFAAGFALEKQDGSTIASASVIGAGTAFLGVYYGTDRNLALGTSSLTVTASLIGGVSGGVLGGLISGSQDVLLPLIGGGLVIGGVAGYLAGDRTHPTPGDAAVINSGALWGTVAGSLFSATFKPGDQISSGLVLSGLGMGTVAGVVLQRFFTVSRTRALLIDASGLVGVLLALAAENVVQQIVDNHATSSTERTANYALGGLTAGLLLGGIFTRSIDDPKLAITPAVNNVRTGAVSTTTFGIAGSF